MVDIKSSLSEETASAIQAHRLCDGTFMAWRYLECAQEIDAGLVLFRFQNLRLDAAEWLSFGKGFYNLKFGRPHPESSMRRSLECTSN